MKKIFALFIVLTMVFTLAACGDSGNNSAGKTPSGDTDTPSTSQQENNDNDNNDNDNNDEIISCTQEQMEETIVSYFSEISSLKSLSLCGGSSIEYSEADIPWQTVDIWTIYDPTVSYDDLAASMSSQLTAAGLTEEDLSLSIGGYNWTVAVGDKTMYINLRPEDWVEGAHVIYATPEPEE